MTTFKKQLLFIMLGIAILTIGALVAMSATPSGNIKIDPDKTAKIKMVKQENTTTTSNNPVGWWKFDEGTATTCDDATGNGNTGQAHNFATSTMWATGKLGRGLSFDGVDDYVQAGDTNFPTGASARTIGFWIKRSVSGNFPNSFYPIIYGTDAQYRRFGAYGLQGTTDLYWHGYAYDFDTGINLDDTNWHYIVIGYDGVNGRSYKDGVESANSPTSMPLLNTLLAVNDFYIGNSWLSQPFNGFMDDVRIYNRALTAGEVLQQYNSTKDGYLGNIKVSTGLVGWWKMDEASWATSSGSSTEAVVRDYSRYANNGTPYAHASTTAAGGGQVGRAGSFDGVDDYVSVANNASLQPTAGVTVSAWINTPVITTSHGIVSRITSGGANGYGLWARGSGKMSMIIDYGSSWDEVLSNTLIQSNYNTWQHWVGTYNGVNLKIYYNGVLDNTKERIGGIDYASIPLYIGAIDSVYLFNGIIDDVKIWNYVRTAEQIKQDYERGLAGHE